MRQKSSDKCDSMNKQTKQIKNLQDQVAKLQKELELLKNETVESENNVSFSRDDHENVLGVISKIDELLDNSIDEITKHVDKEKFKKPKAKALAIMNGLKIYAILSIFKNCETAMEILFAFPDFYSFIDCEELRIADKSVDFKKLKDLIVEVRKSANFSYDCLGMMNNMFYNSTSTTSTIEGRDGKIQRKVCFFDLNNVFDHDFNDSQLRLYFQQDKTQRGVYKKRLRKMTPFKVSYE